MTGVLSLFPPVVVGAFLFYLFCKGNDFALGLLKTWKNPEIQFKSRIMRDGIIRWIAELLAIVFVMILDLFLGLNYIIATATLALFIYREAGSILENLKECGVIVPKGVVDAVETINPEKKEDK